MDIGVVAVNALTLACIYGMLAIGISITWSSLGLVNLAYGFMFAFAGYGAWQSSTWFTAAHIAVPPIAILGIGVLCGALAGLLVCALAFIPIHDKPNFTMRGMVATIAIDVIGTQTLLWYFGPRAKALPEIFGYWQFEYGGIVLTANTLGAMGSSILLLGAVLLWMKSSRRGLEIRAMMMNPHAASLVGIGVRHTGFYVMALTGVAVADLLRQSLLWFHAAHQGRLDCAVRRPRQRDRCGDRGGITRHQRGSDRRHHRRAVRADHAIRADHRHHPGAAARHRRHS